VKLALVHASQSNSFMREMLEGIASEARIAGVDAEVIDDWFPDDDDTVFVVIPHEYFAVVPRAEWPGPRLLARTFALTVEHPGTQWFEISAEQARRCGQIIDINHDSTLELRRRGQPATHFQLGYTVYNDRWHSADNLRSIDIAYLGSTDPKRDALLAGYSALWWQHNVRLLIPGHHPKTGDGTDFVSGETKLELLRDTRVLLNLHRDQSQALEWVRVLEAITNGAVILSEHSVDAYPLIAGKHFISASTSSLGILAADILDHDARLTDLRNSAYEFITTELRLATAVESLLELAEKLLRRPGIVAEADTVSDPPRPPARQPAWMNLPANSRQAAVRPLPTVPVNVTRTFESPSFRDAAPSVSVIVPAFEAAGFITDALNSIVSSRGVSYEILVHDDGSSLSSASAVETFVFDHPGVPLSFVETNINQGTSAARNALLARARAEFVFTLDADNGVYPTALGRLAAALIADPGAAFAYSAIAVFNGKLPQSFLSARSWDPSLFRYGNYIDNMAMYRASELREVGGWDSLGNWEDFHLLLRFAEAGKRGAFVAQALSWYRVFSGSRSQHPPTRLHALWSEMRAAAPTILAD
jgi:hypothetical protein